MSSYPPPRPPADWKQQRRDQRDQARYQREIYRAQIRAGRRGSIVGPLLIILLGVVFLLVQTGHLQSSRLWVWYGRWWPALLVGLGLVLLAEWVLDRAVSQHNLQETSGAPNFAFGPPRRTMGAGVTTLIVLLLLAGAFAGAFAHHRERDFFARGFNLNPDNLDQFLGDKHESDESLLHALPPGTSLSIENPRGDVTVSGTSNDGQVHVSLHKEVYSRSDSEANDKMRRLDPKIDLSGDHMTMSVPAAEGGRADLTLLLPPSIPLTITANHGDVRVNSMHSVLTLIANHGNTDLTGITGNVSVHSNSGSGSISGHDLKGTVSIEGHGHDLTLSDLSGPVSINGDFFGTTHLERIDGAVKFHTSRTDLQLGRLAGEVELSPDANLTVAEAVGPIAINTRNRNITLDHVSGNLTVTNHNGSVDVTSAVPLGNVTIDSRNGSVDLSLPKSASFNVQAQTSDGDVNNDFDLKTAGDENHPTLTGSVGSGGPLIRISTSQGDISLRKTGSNPVLTSSPHTTSPDTANFPTLSVRGKDGSSVFLGKDGLRVTSNADGSSVILGKDGLHITSNADGSSIYHARNGTELVQNADGTKIFRTPSGIRYTENANGTKILIMANGTQITLSADGHGTAVDGTGKDLSTITISEKIQAIQDQMSSVEQQRDRARKEELARAHNN